MLQKKEIICIVCPKGCRITVTADGAGISEISGNQCKRGNEYAVCEFSNPERMLTTTVKLQGKVRRMLPVRSSKPLPKDMLMECMKIINNVEVKAPVRIGDVVISSILDTGIDIIATKDFN